MDFKTQAKSSYETCSDAATNPRLVVQMRCSDIDRQMYSVQVAIPLASSLLACSFSSNNNTFIYRELSIKVLYWVKTKQAKTCDAIKLSQPAPAVFKIEVGIHVSSDSADQPAVICPPLRDIRVRAVPKEDVTDQDPVCRRHRRHEGRLQGKLREFSENFAPYVFILPGGLQLAREVLDIAAMMVKPGTTTEEIDHAVHLVFILLQSLFSFLHSEVQGLSQIIKPTESSAVLN